MAPGRSYIHGRHDGPSLHHHLDGAWGMTANETSTSPPKRSAAYTRYFFVVGLLVYFAVVWYLGWRKIGEEFLSARPELMVLSAGIIFAGIWLRAWKWRYVLGAGQGATGLFFLSKATANWSPGRVGEFAPMILKRHRTASLGAWILMDRLLEITVALALGLVGLAIISFLPFWSMVTATVVTAAITGATFYGVTRKAFFEAFAARRKEGSRLEGLSRFIADVSGEIGGLRTKLPLAAAITLLTKCTDLWAVALLFTSFGYRAGFALVAAAKCALAIVSFFPITPTATGVPHATQAWIMNQIADIPYEGLVAVIGAEVAIVSVTFWTGFGLASAFIRDATRNP